MILRADLMIPGEARRGPGIIGEGPRGESSYAGGTPGERKEASEAYEGNEVSIEVGKQPSEDATRSDRKAERRRWRSEAERSIHRNGAQARSDCASEASVRP